jgi:hypothetical protein
MSKQPLTPHDIAIAARYIVSGQPRRVRDYNLAVASILGHTSPAFVEYVAPGKTEPGRAYLPRGKGGTSDPTANAAEAIDALEENPDVKTMREVQAAEAEIGLDIESKAVAERLRRGIILNCINPRRHPYERLDVAGIGRTDFYTRRAIFLADVARRCGLR